MEVTVYNGEKFERKALWYIIAGTVFAVIVLLSLFTGNIAGVVLLCLFLGGYLYYGFVDTNKLVQLVIQPDGLLIHRKLYAWTTIHQFALEVDTRTQRLHNIIFQLNGYHAIYTFAQEDVEQIRAFVGALQQYVPLVEMIQETFLEKVTRRLKL